MKEVIILGAGASKSVGAALQGEIIEKFFKANKNSVTIKFFENFFGIDNFNIDRKPYPTLEEILGLMEINNALTDNKDFPNIIDSRVNELEIMSMICTVLKETIEGPAFSYNKNHPHEILIKRLMREGKIQDTSFISLNYDMILEYRIFKTSRFGIDYGIDTFYFNDNTKEKIKVYKPHGSLNWGYCETCGKIKIFFYKALYDLISGINCPECKKKLVPFIISPTYFKYFSDSFYKNLLKKVKDLLENTEVIYFCGYSFPDADLDLKYVLKQIEIEDPIPEIYICNGRYKKVKDPEFERFLRFFKNKDRIHYLSQSFQSFARNGIDLSKECKYESK